MSFGIPGSSGLSVGGSVVERDPSLLGKRYDWDFFLLRLLLQATSLCYAYCDSCFQQSWLRQSSISHEQGQSHLSGAEHHNCRDPSGPAALMSLASESFIGYLKNYYYYYTNGNTFFQFIFLHDILIMYICMQRDRLLLRGSRSLGV